MLRTHSSETINEDGTPVLIEAVYYRHHRVYIYEAETVEEARSFLENGEDYGDLSSVGVFVEGEPKIFKYGPSYHPEMTDKDIAAMREGYTKAKREAR